MNKISDKLYSWASIIEDHTLSQAYKDIDIVMRDSADLIDIKHTLRQIVNIKGD